MGKDPFVRIDIVWKSRDFFLMIVSSWRRFWKGIEAKGEGHLLMQELLQAYEQPQRTYHTRQHLTECLEHFEVHQAEMAEPALVEAALWFHDAVYEPTSSVNEWESAQWAERALAIAGVSSERIEKIVALILVTQHQGLPRDGEEAWMVDLDLAILGAIPSRFAEYERQVREEYLWVPERVFANKRAELLQGFLNRPVIYQHEGFRDKYEAAARRNLESSLKRLRAQASGES